MNSTEIARVKRRFQKKHIKHRRPLMMVVREDLRAVRIISVDAIHVTDLPEGVYEIRTISNPDHKKRSKDTRWIVVYNGKNLIGAAKNYFKQLRLAGVVDFYLGKSQAQS